MNQFAICHLGVIPCRAEPTDKSELVTQWLFGDIVSILEQQGNWIKVEGEQDRYQGWVDFKQIQPITEQNYLVHKSYPHQQITDSLFTAITWQDTQVVQWIPLGSQINCDASGIGHLGNKKYQITGKIPQPHSNKDLVLIAKSMLMAPYLWGGKTAMGIDCSGFTQVVYRTASVQLPRDASQQYLLGTERIYLEDYKPLDLAFFDNDQGKIIHVGIVLSNNQIIHASGEVRFDQLDATGIFNKERNCYTHQLKSIKKVI